MDFAYCDAWKPNYTCSRCGSRTTGLRLCPTGPITDRMQGVDCYYCEDGTPHTHRRPMAMKGVADALTSGSGAAGIHCAKLEARITELEAKLVLMEESAQERIAAEMGAAEVLKRALELACEVGRVVELRPAPKEWRDLSLDERVAHFVERARRELADG